MIEVKPSCAGSFTPVFHFHHNLVFNDNLLPHDPPEVSIRISAKLNLSEVGTRAWKSRMCAADSTHLELTGYCHLGVVPNFCAHHFGELLLEICVICLQTRSCV